MLVTLRSDGWPPSLYQEPMKIQTMIIVLILYVFVEI